jgi:integrase
MLHQIRKMLHLKGCNMAIVVYCASCKSNYKIGIKKCPKCGSSDRSSRKYRVMLRQDGKQITRVVDNLELARELESKWRTEIVRGEHAITRKTAVPTLADIWTKYYLPWAKEHKTSWEADNNRYELHIKGTLGNKPLNKILPLDIQRLISSMKKNKSTRGNTFSQATLKQIIALLSRVFSLTIKWNLFNGVNPCSKVDKPKLDNQVTNYLSSEETGNLLAVLDTWPDKIAANLILFDMFTGVRRSSLFRLKWEDVNFENQTIRIYLKGGNHTEIKLSTQALDILKNTQPVSDYVFPGKVKIIKKSDGTKTKEYDQRTDIKHSWQAIKDAAGITRPFRFHDIRHNLASKLVSAGATLYEVQMALAHRDPRTTMRYAHLDPSRMQKIADMGAQIIADSGKQEKGVEKKTA